MSLDEAYWLALQCGSSNPGSGIAITREIEQQFPAPATAYELHRSMALEIQRAPWSAVGLEDVRLDLVEHVRATRVLVILSGLSRRHGQRVAVRVEAHIAELLNSERRRGLIEAMKGELRQVAQGGTPTPTTFVRCDARADFGRLVCRLPFGHRPDVAHDWEESEAYRHSRRSLEDRQAAYRWARTQSEMSSGSAMPVLGNGASPEELGARGLYRCVEPWCIATVVRDLVRAGEVGWRFLAGRPCCPEHVGGR